MKNRFKQVRQHENINLSQEAFGKRLGVTGAAISRIESGNREPSEQIILAICREFNVNETWLRTGKGEMFVQKSRSDEISDFIGDILSGDPDFRRLFISLLARMTTDEWRLLEKKALELATAVQSAVPKSGTTASEPPRVDIAAELAELKRQNQELVAEIAALKEEESKPERSNAPGPASR